MIAKVLVSAGSTTERVRRVVQLLVAIGVSVAFTAFVALRVDLEELLRHLRAVGAARAGLGAGVVAITVLLRAIRLCRSLGERPSLDIGSASVVHNALVAILPAKLGEFALPAMLMRLRGTEAVGGLGILVALRIFDLLALGLVGGAAAAVVLEGALRALMALAAGISAVALLSVPWLGGRFAAVAEREPNGSRFDKLVRSASRGLSQFGSRSGWQVSILSIAIWLSLFTSFYIFTAGDSLGWAEVAVEGTAGSMAFALPISGVANVGPFQAAWVAASGLLGHPEDALLRALMAHGAVLVVTAGLACVAGTCLIILGRRPPELRT